MNQPNQIFEEFKPISKEEWLAKIEKDLRGAAIADFDIDMGGISIGAFHLKDNEGQLRKPLLGKPGWKIGEDFMVGIEALQDTNKQLIAALENGIDSPRLIISGSLSVDDLSVLLNGVDLSIIEIHFLFKKGVADPVATLANLIEYANANGVSASALTGTVSGHEAKLQAEIFDHVLKNKLGLKTLSINGVGGFSESDTAQELADMVADGEKCISQYGSGMADPKSVADQIHFSIAIGKNYFLQIAKIRALKLLWANVLKTYGLDGDHAIYLDAHIPESTLVEDPNSNMIAATIQAMSAVIGGVDRLTVIRSNANHSSEADPFSVRIARNVQHILQQESYMASVQDPGAGSYFIEELTFRLAEKAWSVFQNK